MTLRYSCSVFVLVSVSTSVFFVFVFVCLYLWNLHLLNDEVEVVPPSVGKQAGVEGKRNKRRILRISSLAISNFVVIINIVIFIWYPPTVSVSVQVKCSVHPCQLSSLIKVTPIQQQNKTSKKKKDKTPTEQRITCPSRTKPVLHIKSNAKTFA